MIIKNLVCVECGIIFKGKRAKICKKCSDKKYYAKNHEKVIKSTAKWRAKNHEKYRANDRKWRKKYQKSETFKEARRIRDFARYSLREAIIKRQEGICLDCPKPIVDLHHLNYTKNSEDVVGLCKECHNERHKKLRRITTKGELNLEHQKLL
jgi:hypothetical protein